MRRSFFVFGILAGLILLAACETVSDEPVFDLSPKIELVAVSSDTIVQFQDSLSIIIRYEDGDGDLGNDNSEINSLFVKDARLEKEDEYYLAPIAPTGSEVSITGTINLILGKTFILGNAPQEQTTFTIHLVDQAGNQSNTIQTNPITIIKE